MDIFEAIDRATGCHFREGPMGGSVSDLFCREECQQAWAARRVGADVEPVSPFEHFRQRHMLTALGDGDLFFTPVGTDPDLVNSAWTPAGTIRTTDAPVTMGMDVDLNGNIAASFTRRVEGQPHVVYAVLDETHVWRDEQLAAFMRVHHEALRARIAGMVAALSPAMVALGEAWRAASENFKAVHAALVEAGVVEKPLPADPQARALALRKRRNTGPQQQRRAPRAINPRRAR